MTVTMARQQVRSALAEFIEGSTPLPAFEQSIAKVLASQGSQRGEVQEELQAAVKDGTLPPESLRRLGLISAVPPLRAVPDAPAGAQLIEGTQIIHDGALYSAADSIGAGADGRDAKTAAPRRNVRPGVLLGGRYRLERELGEGGMGVVYSATDEEVRGETFAIKVIKAEIREMPSSLRLLREEVRRTRALRHANIVGVYSLNSDPLGVYMLMEYLEGKSLTSLLDEEFGRGMPWMRAWPVISDIGSALSYAHDHNVIHSDLKPSNVFITTSGTAKLLDFGIARAVRTRTARLDPSVMGGLTPAYASYEMFEGAPPDQSDDVYSFACVIYEMLTGKHPFNRVSSVEAHTRRYQPAPVPALTGRQNAALARALAFERAQRTRSVEDLLAGLKGMATDKRRQQIWLATGAASLAAAGLAAFLGLHERPGGNRDAIQAAREPEIPAQTQANDGVMQMLPKPDRLQQAPPAGAAAPPMRKRDLDALLMPVAISPSARKLPVPEIAAPAAAPAGPPAAPPAVTLPKFAEPTRVADAQKAPAVAVPIATAAAVAAAKAAVPTAAAALPIDKPADKAVDKPAAKPIVAPPAPSLGKAANPVLTAAAIPVATPTAVSIEKPIEKPVDKSGDKAADKPADKSAAAPAAAVRPVPVPASVTLASPASAGSGSPAAAEVSTAQPLPLRIARRNDMDQPPPGKYIPSIIATPDSQAVMNSDKCPYPAEARNRVETGTVVLLVYVMPDGTAPNPQIDTTSGSDSLDQAAIACIRDNGRFAPKLAGKQTSGYWARTKFRWSFGD